MSSHLPLGDLMNFEKHARFVQVTCRILCAYGVLVCLVGCTAVERKILYGRRQSVLQKRVKLSVCASDVAAEEVFFKAADGTRLYGWFVEPTESHANLAVLFSHGRSGTVASFQSQVVDFVRRHQVSLFVYDYRGFGQSDGCPSECGLYQDAHAARDWLASRTSQTPQDIVLMGRSLGSAVAIHLASVDGAKALIVESGFTSFPDVVRHHTGNVLRGHRLKSQFDSASKIRSYKGPVFISHGIRDKLIPFEHGVNLAENAIQANSVRLVQLDGGHKARTNHEYSAELSRFFNQLPEALH